jgi:hypothetical protein
MQSKIHTWCAFLCIVVFNANLVLGQGHNSRDAYTRFGIAPVVGFYKLNSYHALNPKARMSFSVFLKREKSMDRSNRAFLSIGLEYLLHGVSYRSYYFSQDTLQLYNGNMGFNYRLNIGELNAPIQAKITFKSTTNSLITPYLSVGYHLRYILNTNLRVDQDGAELKDEFVHLKFKNPLLQDRFNSFAGINFGVQNHRTRSNSITVFLELSYRYGFSPFGFKTNYSASSVYLSSQHLALNLGIGF